MQTTTVILVPDSHEQPSRGCLLPGFQSQSRPCRVHPFCRGDSAKGRRKEPTTLLPEPDKRSPRLTWHLPQIHREGLPATSLLQIWLSPVALHFDRPQTSSRGSGYLAAELPVRLPSSRLRAAVLHFWCQL